MKGQFNTTPLNLTSEDREIFNDFIAESKESIEEIEPLLIEMEDNFFELDTVDTGLINKIFRVFHSIKGSASFIGLNLTSSVTHQAETLLDLIRKEKISLTKEHVDVFLELCDFFINLLDHIKENFSEAGFEEKAEDFVEQLKELIARDSGESANEKKKKPKSKKKTSAPKSTVPEKEENPVQSADQSELENLITPEMIKQFVQDSRELLEGLEQDLLSLEKEPANPDLIESAFRGLHSLKGNAGFFGCLDISQICHRAESFLDEVRNGRIQAESEQFSILLQILDFLSTAVNNLNKGGSPKIAGKAGVMDLMTDFLVIGDAGEQDDVSLAETEAETPAQEESIADNIPPETEQGPQTVPDKIINRPTAAESRARETAAPGSLSRSNSGGSKSNGTNEVIRVDVYKLNTLMDLVGEIVIAESMVSQHPDIVGRDMPDFEKSVMHLQKNIRELQELATSMRMIPLSGLFRKMIRLVRDLSNKSKKKVELEIKGGETEVDRSVIEHISDPLVHIIRNSVDHGIEPSDKRKNSGKPEVGKITLEATQVGGEIWISIRDDGQGLNRERILAKAIERGLISGNGDDLSDQNVWNLIFAPGFSTAEKITDISGRGVGMDVVQKNIEKIRGKIEVKSEDGQGTTILLRIPLTTAIIDGMLVRVHNSLYAIPMLDIKESLQVFSKSLVRMVDGQEVVKIREKLFPVVRIHELHELHCEKKDLTEGILILVENGGKSLCLFADELIEQKQLVIKPMPEFIGELEGVSGCAILGNGDISLILDISNLIKIAESSQELEGAK
ncbi:MAG: chemotaxis protein CheA [Calditrichia bacterium]